jgi:hypothetical protein
MVSLTKPHILLGDLIDGAMEVLSADFEQTNCVVVSSTFINTYQITVKVVEPWPNFLLRE